MQTASFFTYTGPGRVSIARYAPRNTPAGYRQFRALAPGPWFNSVTKDVYIQRYSAEVLEKLDPSDTVRKLEELAGKDADGKQIEPVLLCWEKPTDHDSWCHRAIVADWFRLHLQLDVFERGYEGKPHPLAV